jgi:tRNA-specific adenosine deaminase 1
VCHSSDLRAAYSAHPSIRLRSRLSQSNATTTLPPSFNELARVAAVSAVPFVGFGLCDNAIMARCHTPTHAHAPRASHRTSSDARALPLQILSGDAIEATVGVALGLSTMAAAGCGNMVSDVLGIGISGWIERTCDAAGFRSRLSAAQMQLRSTQSACACGTRAVACACEQHVVRCAASTPKPLATWPDAKLCAALRLCLQW